MKGNNSIFTLVLSIGALGTAGIGCSGSFSTDGNTNNAAVSNSAVKTVNTVPSTNSAPVASRNIAGEYEANGTNPGGGGGYKAELTVTPRDDVYQFSWKSGADDYDGVAVTTDNAAAVAYTTGKNGEGCGVVLYKINADGSLDGKVGYWGQNKMEIEKAVRKSGTELEGEYTVSGKNPDGEEYKGDLSVKRQGLGYKFKWSAPDIVEGFGIKANNLIAVGFGGKECSFVGYDIEPDGTLNGTWGDETSTSLGTEVAKKK